ncbi:hypothetical protein KIN20_000994 [Parelaphostrongylus tenuis]|uniref:Ribophorin II C-terminal domain-containing protein n=1 Tax=Parelaphostrongylus tenuis TaxID=148309 RepID=A0AAD5QGL8_PARTN|nr:hypothetical protein KIN20_000994 [Parelaphostrongylus tenuis]
MPLSVWTLFIHGSLAVLLALYLVFWLQLNMFETLRYLAFVEAFTCISCNRVLRSIADKSNNESLVTQTQQRTYFIRLQYTVSLGVRDADEVEQIVQPCWLSTQKVESSETKELKFF